jgi:LacI family transcriptional regulator
LAIDDHRVRLALVLINEHAAEGWKVVDVARAAGVSRSTLENHFKATLRRSVSDELRRVRLELAKKLTVETQIPLKEIAARTAFRSVQHMTSIFRRYTGKTPAAFRRTGGGVGSSHTG